jgi:hypothetical protein
MKLMNVAKAIGVKLGPHKPLAAALLVVAITVLTVGFLSYTFFGYAAKDARFGNGMRGHGFGGPAGAGFNEWTPPVQDWGCSHKMNAQVKCGHGFGAAAGRGPDPMQNMQPGQSNQTMPQGCPCAQSMQPA